MNHLKGPTDWLPELLNRCTVLTRLDPLSCSNLRVLPESIGGCTALTKLILRNCSSLSAIPESIGGCTALTELSLYNCSSLRVLPEAIGSCTALTKLNLGNCSLTQLPKNLDSCTQLDADSTQQFQEAFDKAPLAPGIRSLGKGLLVRHLLSLHKIQRKLAILSPFRHLIISSSFYE